jgi:CrcB protein
MSLANRRRAAVAAGGAIGAVGRALVIDLVDQSALDPLWATLFVNVAGSLLLGFVVGWHTNKARSSPYVIPFAGIGILGAFTTFSLFSTEVFALLRTGDAVTALVYVAGSIVAGFMAALIGIRIGRSA